MNDFRGTKSIGQFIPGILLAGLLVLGFMVLREFLLTLIWAFIIAYVTWPPYRWLRYRLNNNATLSAAIMATIISAIMLLAAYSLIDILKDELQTTYQSLAVNLNRPDYRLPDSIRQLPWLGNYLQEGLDKLADDRAGVATQIANWAKQWLGEFAKLLGGIGHNLMKLGVILVTVFFCFRDGQEAIQQLHQGLNYFLGKYLAVYLQAAGSTTRAVVYGLVLAAMGQGVMAGIGYAAAGINAPLLFGIITALLAMIPMGATLVWMPMAITLIITNQLWSGIGLLLWGFLVISTIDNVIRPIVISDSSRMPFLVVMFGVLGGLSAFGAVGLFLGPVILSVLMAVWKAWLEQQKLERDVSE
jgi:P-type Ca2+ transporter type 2C